MFQSDDTASLGADKNPNKPITVSNKTPEQVELIRQTLDVYQNSETYRMRNCCQICDKELSADELESISIHAFMHTCGEHRKYSNFFNVQLVRDMLARGENPLDSASIKAAMGFA